MPFTRAARHARFWLALSTLLLPAALRAEITPDAKPVVDRYVEATGGPAALAAVQSTRMKTSITAFGLNGSSTVYTQRPDLRGSNTEIGPLKFREGYDGTTAWRTDPGTGKLVILDGKDLEDAKASAYFDLELWALPDQGGGKVALVGNEQDSTGTHTVLEITPPVGRARRLYIDPNTGLIDRAVSKRDQLEITTTLKDYRRAGGRMIPFDQFTRITGMPANDLHLVVDSLWVNETLPDTLFKAGAAPVQAPQYLKTPGLARLPFHYLGRHVWLRASVNGGEPADFIFDTGASITVIDSAYAASAGIHGMGKMQAQGAGSQGGASFAQLQSLRVAGSDGDGIEVRDVRVAVLGVNPFLAPFFWRDCAGIVGYDFISRFVSEIDFDHEVLTLHDPKTFKYSGPGTTLPFELAGTVPAVKMKLDGQYEGTFRVDVGSGSTVDLHTPFVKRNGLAEKAGKGVEVTGGGFGGTFKSRLVRMEKIELGPYAWQKPLVLLSAAESGALASEDYAGNIGTQILDRFKCFFDYDRRQIILEPGAKYAKADQFTRAGVQLARYGDRVKTMEVVAGSPAARAGIEEGDVVVSIEGKPILSYTPDDLRAQFDEGKPGRKVVFEVSRGGKKQKLTLTLADIL